MNVGCWFLWGLFVHFCLFAFKVLSPLSAAVTVGGLPGRLVVAQMRRLSEKQVIQKSV